MSFNSLGKRIKARREKLRFTQDELSRSMGFGDRQTLSAIETGVRDLSAEELVKLTEVLDAPLEYFTDPFHLAGEGSFSWRQSKVARRDLDNFERHAGGLVALYRTLYADSGRVPSPLRHSLRLSKFSRFEEAGDAGERFASEYDLGDVPALRLVDVMERELGILVLMVDPIPGVSGAACRLENLDAVIINRNEGRGRRNYNLAHELFHVLTWDSMPPERVEDSASPASGRVERLANSFAAALLMPSEAIERFGPWRGLSEDDLIDQLNKVADELNVSSSALKWRLVGLGKLPHPVACSLDVTRLRNNGHARPHGDIPPRFSRPFSALVAESLDKGRVSTRRVAKLLDLAIDDLPDAFAEHGVDFELAI